MGWNPDSTLEDWILLGLKLHHPLPVIWVYQRGAVFHYLAQRKGRKDNVTSTLRSSRLSITYFSNHHRAPPHTSKSTRAPSVAVFGWARCFPITVKDQRGGGRASRSGSDLKKCSAPSLISSKIPTDNSESFFRLDLLLCPSC
jgi:hypothetical protein